MTRFGTSQTYCHRAVLGLVFAALLCAPATAQSHNLRGTSDATPNLLPEPRQLLDQNRTRQQSTFSTRQLLDARDRLNQADAINRQNMRPQTLPCNPATDPSCRP